MKKILVILGPTATGKTDLAFYLARKFNGEIIACDSRQVYKGLDIGTGKKPTKYNESVKVHQYDIVDLATQFTVYDYTKRTLPIVEDILSRRKLPIIVGGTGLYLKALLEGFSNLSLEFDENLRKSLSALSLAELQEKLKDISIDAWEKLNDSDKKNPRRLIRAIEILSSKRKENFIEGLLEKYQVLKIGLTKSRDDLYQGINENVEKWIDEGIIDEIKHLQNKGVTLERIRQIGLNYRPIADFLEGKITKYELIKKMQIAVRNYAKRQITWFKKDKDISWFDVNKKDFLSQVENKIELWYDAT